MDNEEYYYELYHHGVKGMKWGVRRTPQQLGHKTASDSLMSKAKKSIKSRVEASKKKKASKKQEPELSLEAKKEAVLKSRSAKQLYDNAHLFSDTELKNAYNRLMTEKNIKDLAPAEISKGKQFVTKAIEVGKSVNDLATVGIKTWNLTAQVVNAIDPTAKLPTIGDKKKDDKKTYNYDNLRSKELNSLTDDELKALNTRNQQERTYRNNLASQAKSENKTTNGQTSTSNDYKRKISGFRSARVQRVKN